MARSPISAEDTAGRTGGARETQRLSALRDYEILDTVPEERFDRITALAAALFQVEIAFISFTDADRFWFKSGHGIDWTAWPREIRLENPARQIREELLDAPDLLLDSIEGCPYAGLIERHKLRFFVRAPLRAAGGLVIGTLSLCDRTPRDRPLTGAEIAHLQRLTAMVMDELELRRELGRRAELERDRKLIGELSAAIVQAPNLEDALDTALKALCGSVGAAFGEALEILLPDGGAMTVVAVHADDSLPELQRHLARERQMRIEGTSLPAGGGVPPGIKTLITIPLAHDGRSFNLNFGFADEPGDVFALKRRLAERAQSLRPFLARQMLEERFALMRSAVTHAHEGIMITEAVQHGDPDPRIVYVNPAFEQLSGYEAAESVGRSTDMLHGAETCPGTIDQLRAHYAEGTNCRAEIQLYRKDDSDFWCELEISPVIGPHDRLTHWIGVLRDTTQRRRSQSRLLEREAAFRQLFRNNPVPMWVYDREDLGFIEVNDAAVRKFGWAREQFLSKTLLDLHAPQDRDRLQRVLGDIDLEKQAKGIWTYVAANGAEILADVSCYTVASEERGRVLSVIVDITDQKMAEDALRRSQEELRRVVMERSAVLDALPVEIALVDGAGRLAFFNRRWGDLAVAEDMAGYDAGLGTDYIDLCTRDGLPGSTAGADVARGLRAVLECEIPSFELEYARRSDDRPRWLKTMITPVSDDPARDGAVVMHLDVTEARSNAEHMRTAQRAAEFANQVKSQFLANTSHELRTPLNAIIGFSELLSQNPKQALSGKQLEYVGYIHRSGVHLLNLINELLDLSKIEAGRLQLDEEVADICQIATECINLLKPQTDLNRIRVTLDVPRDTALLCDALRVKQILLNLIANAIKFTEEDGEVRLSVAYSPSGETVIEIADTGIGMDETELRLALEPFTRLDRNPLRKTEGTGLGLALVSRLTALHGGRLDISSAIGRGTIVRIVFPPERTRLAA
jgi:PAS domain S-box-containing protein